jgi:hypothetical protein
MGFYSIGMRYSWYTTDTIKYGQAALLTLLTSHERISSVDLKSTTKTFYVYILARPNGKPFYVGKGKGRRIFDHEKEARSGHVCHKCNVIRKIWKQGGEIQRYTVFETDDEQEALDYERNQIALHGRKNLCNQTDGGDGIMGYKASPLERAEKSALLKRLWKTPEFRASQAAGQTRRWQNPEQVARQRELSLARFQDPEFRAQTIQRNLARWRDPESRARGTERAKLFYQLPERRALISARQIKRYEDPEERLLQSLRMKEACQDPEFIASRGARTKALWQTPEYREKISSRAKARYTDPEQRAQQSARMKATWEKRKAKKVDPE